jgi:hypothetical protein
MLLTFPVVVSVETRRSASVLPPGFRDHREADPLAGDFRNRPPRGSEGRLPAGSIHGATRSEPLPNFLDRQRLSVLEFCPPDPGTTLDQSGLHRASRFLDMRGIEFSTGGGSIECTAN